MSRITIFALQLFTCIFFELCFSLQPYNKVVIIGTNDIHGTAFPTQLFRSDTNETYKYGGLVYMARLIQILQEENPGKILFLDAGDQFQGGLQSSSLVSNGEIMDDFYNLIGLKGSAIGNHQFDYGPQFLQKYLQNRYSDSIAANLRSQKGQSNFLTNQKSSKIYQINGFKIGVIGLATPQTLKTSDGFIKHLFPNFQFLQYKDIVIQQSSKLREDGADMIIILSHADNIPEGTVDAVVQGHRHTIAHYYYRGIPIMGVTKGGYYFNAMHITYQKKTKKIKDIVIEGPIPVCQKVFENTKKCNYLTQSQLSIAGKLVNWQFHGKDVYAQPTLYNIFESKWRPLMAPYMKQICKNQIYLTIDQKNQTQLGNLVTSLIHNTVPDADFVILNAGLFRNTWIPGMLQYENYYSMFPFDDIIQTFDMTGKELIETLKIIQSSNNGFYQVWNLYNQLQLVAANQTKSFKSAKFYNGTQIDNSTIYKGISTDFLLKGGDDFQDIIGTIYEVKNQGIIGSFRQLLQQQLSKIEKIAKGVWLDPEHPRLNITII